MLEKSSSLPSYLNSEHLGPWGTFPTRSIGSRPTRPSRAGRDAERPKRILIVDVPIALDNGTVTNSKAIASSTISRADRARRRALP